MYSIKLINPLRQYGTVCWTLLFEDPAGGLPSLRVEKKYDGTLTPEEICTDISSSIVAMIADATRTEEGNGVYIDVSGETVEVDDIGGEHYQWQL